MQLYYHNYQLFIFLFVIAKVTRVHNIDPTDAGSNPITTEKQPAYPMEVPESTNQRSKLG